MVQNTTPGAWVSTSTELGTKITGSIEAENLTFENYEIEASSDASGDAVLKVMDKSIAATATYVFDGADGVYDMSVGFLDESDGAGSFEVYVEGKLAFAWTADADNDDFQIQTISALPLLSGQTIEIVARADAGERMRLDFLEFTGFVTEAPTTSDTSETTEPEPTPASSSTQAAVAAPVSWRVEAEAMALTGYATESRSDASGDKVIRAVLDLGENASAKSTFGGATGTYDLTLGYLDENDGQSEMSLWIDGTKIRDWSLNKDTNAYEEITVSGLYIEKGQTVEVLGARNYGERARLDYIDYALVAEDTGASDGGQQDDGQQDGGQQGASEEEADFSVMIEAEDLTLSGFSVEQQSAASGGAVIKTQGTGTASYVHDGPSGTFDIGVTYLDENDGASSVEVFVDRESVGTWTLTNNDNEYTTKTIQGVDIESGQTISLVGERQSGERARIDYLELAAGYKDLADTTGSSRPGAGDYQIKVEAEDLRLSNYIVEGDGDASGKQVIRTEGSGTARYDFDGPAGVFDISVTYLDENDGVSPIELFVGNTSIGRWTMSADDNAFATITFEDVQISSGQTITLEGEKNFGERARIDFIEIKSVELSDGGSDPDPNPDPTPVPDPEPEPEPDPDPVDPVDPPSDPKDLGETDASMFAPYAEWTLSNSSVSGNPYDLEATVTFTHQGTGQTMKTGMFYNGDGTYSFRFSGVESGEWSFRTQSNDGDLNGYSGTVMVSADNDARGFVVTENGKFAQELGDGSLEAILPNYAMIPADLSEYRDNPNKIDELIDLFIVQHGFTGLHIPNIGGQWFNINNNEGDAGSAIGSSKTNPDPRTFEVLETIIEKVHEAGGVLHFWPWGDSQRGQTPEELPGGQNGAEHLRLLEYMADRLGPLPGWTMGYGFDNDEWTSPEEAAERTAFFDAQTDFDHLLTVRSEGPNSGTDHSRDVEWHFDQDFTDFEHHSPTYEVYLAAVDAADGQAVLSGDRFRVRGEDGPGKDYTQAETVDGLWHSTMAGGVSNIWGNLTDPNTGKIERTGNFETYSYNNETKREISTWDTFFNEKGRFALDAEVANNLTGGTRNDQFALLSESENSLIVYAEDTNDIDLNLRALSSDSDWSGGVRIIAVDTEAAYREINMGTRSLNDFTLDMSGTSDWALYITPIDM